VTRIGETLGTAGPTVSLEFSPPRDDEDEAQLARVLDELSAVRPSFASVTYGALGSTRERTRDVVVRFNREHDFPTMAHLTCVGHSKADIRDLLDHYAANGVENILALGGDPPADGSDPGGDFAHAMQLVEVVRDGVDAGYVTRRGARLILLHRVLGTPTREVASLEGRRAAAVRKARERAEAALVAAAGAVA
jgi:5,10-methylenetetrahydrofolate reductase